MTIADMKKLKLFAQMRKENIKPKSIKNILELSDDEYRNFSGIIAACDGLTKSSKDYIQPDFFNHSRKYVAEFLIKNPFKFNSIDEVATSAEVSSSTVSRAFRDYPEIKNLLLKNDTKDFHIENVSFHKQTTKKAIQIITDKYFEQGKRIKKAELIDGVGFSNKACQSFLSRFPNFAILVDKD